MKKLSSVLAVQICQKKILVKKSLSLCGCSLGEYRLIQDVRKPHLIQALSYNDPIVSASCNPLSINWLACFAAYSICWLYKNFLLTAKNIFEALANYKYVILAKYMEVLHCECGKMAAQFNTFLMILSCSCSRYFL